MPSLSFLGFLQIQDFRNRFSAIFIGRFPYHRGAPVFPIWLLLVFNAYCLVWILSVLAIGREIGLLQISTRQERFPYTSSGIFWLKWRKIWGMEMSLLPTSLLSLKAISVCPVWAFILWRLVPHLGWCVCGFSDNSYSPVWFVLQLRLHIGYSPSACRRCWHYTKVIPSPPEKLHAQIAGSTLPL